jgi:lipoyl(octanoyl) transferase
MKVHESSHELWICHLGTVPYREAMAAQDEIRARRYAGELPDVLLLLEHPPTYTRGRRAAPAELPYGGAFYAERGIDVVPTDRGGRVTYHGPGQLVGYAIVRVTDVVAHVRMLEAALVAALADEGLAARSRAADGADYTGVWVRERKIASIGVHLSRGVTTHGFAVNFDNDLQPFSWIVPCGLSGVRMTSIAHERAASPPSPGAGSALHAFGERVSERLCAQLGRSPRVAPARELGIDPRFESLYIASAERRASAAPIAVAS